MRKKIIKDVAAFVLAQLVCFSAAGIGGAFTALVWRSGRWSGARGAMLIFGVQLLLNTAWSILFFGARSPGLAFFEILLLWSAIVVTIGIFWQHSKTASVLLVPYLAWSSFAAVLNFTIWQMN